MERVIKPDDLGGGRGVEWGERALLADGSSRCGRRLHRANRPSSFDGRDERTHLYLQAEAKRPSYKKHWKERMIGQPERSHVRPHQYNIGVDVERAVSMAEPLREHIDPEKTDQQPGGHDVGERMEGVGVRIPPNLVSGHECRHEAGGGVGWGVT